MTQTVAQTQVTEEKDTRIEIDFRDFLRGFGVNESSIELAINAINGMRENNK